MDARRWRELGLLTGTQETIEGLLRSLRFGVEDYGDCVYAVVPTVLGYAPAEDLWDLEPSPSLLERLPKLPLVAEHSDLAAWLAMNDTRLFPPHLRDELERCRAA